MFDIEKLAEWRWRIINAVTDKRIKWRNRQIAAAAGRRLKHPGTSLAMLDYMQALVRAHVPNADTGQFADWVEKYIDEDGYIWAPVKEIEKRFKLTRSQRIRVQREWAERGLIFLKIRRYEKSCAVGIKLRADTLQRWMSGDFGRVEEVMESRAQNEDTSGSAENTDETPTREAENTEKTEDRGCSEYPPIPVQDAKPTDEATCAMPADDGGRKEEKTLSEAISLSPGKDANVNINPAALPNSRDSFAAQQPSTNPDNFTSVLKRERNKEEWNGEEWNVVEFLQAQVFKDLQTWKPEHYKWLKRLVLHSTFKSELTLERLKEWYAYRTDELTLRNAPDEQDFFLQCDLNQFCQFWPSIWKFITTEKFRIKASETFDEVANESQAKEIVEEYVRGCYDEFLCFQAAGTVKSLETYAASSSKQPIHLFILMLQSQQFWSEFFGRARQEVVATIKSIPQYVGLLREMQVPLEQWFPEINFVALSQRYTQHRRTLAQRLGLFKFWGMVPE